jgi:hypothetical protein
MQNNEDIYKHIFFIKDSKLGAIRVYSSSFIFAASVCKNVHIGGPHVLGGAII